MTSTSALPVLPASQHQLTQSALAALASSTQPPPRPTPSVSSSNPSQWEGHLPQKRMDLTWNFTAGPLRVTDCTSRQWQRLHAKNRWMIPQPGGAPPLKVTEILPHVSDDELLMQVGLSGVAKPPGVLRPPGFQSEGTQRIKVGASAVSTTWKQSRPMPSTPEMHERLRATAVKPLPTPASAKVRDPAVDDRATSVFSVTTVRTTTTRFSNAAAPQQSASNPNVDGSGAEPSVVPLAPETLVSGASTAKSSRVSAVSAALKEHQSENAKVKVELDAAKQRLQAIEQLLST